jgi:hypothetical protein
VAGVKVDINWCILDFYCCWRAFIINMARSLITLCLLAFVASASAGLGKGVKLNAFSIVQASFPPAPSDWAAATCSGGCKKSSSLEALVLIAIQSASTAPSLYIKVFR